MKTPTEIKQKIRNIEFEYLKGVYQSRLSKDPHNCAYNKKAVLPGSDQALTRVCGYFSDSDSVQVCNTAECSVNCNAFVPRFDKKQLRDLLREDIENNPTKYPELMVLKWALDGENIETSLAEPPAPDIITDNVIVPVSLRKVVWTRTKRWASDVLWGAYFKLSNLVERIFG